KNLQYSNKLLILTIATDELLFLEPFQMVPFVGDLTIVLSAKPKAGFKIRLSIDETGVDPETSLIDYRILSLDSHGLNKFNAKVMITSNLIRTTSSRKLRNFKVEINFQTIEKSITLLASDISIKQIILSQGYVQEFNKTQRLKILPNGNLHFEDENNLNQKFDIPLGPAFE